MHSLGHRALIFSALLTMGVINLKAIVVSGPDPATAEVGYGQLVAGVNLTGVVAVQSSIGGCSGTLLSDGMSILTAGHCVTASYGSALATGINVTFLGPSGNTTQTVTSVAVNPGWTGNGTLGGDLAVLLLSAPAPVFAQSYGLFTGSFTSDPVVLAGWGRTGTGLTGATGGYGVLRAGENEYVTTGSSFGWSASLLVGQFYQTGDPASNLLGAASPYVAADEVDIAHGDSGGPTFINGMLGGVHDLIICQDDPNNSSLCQIPPSVNTANNSYFGQAFADTSVAANAGWIEAQMIPEPASAALFGAGLLCAGAAVRFRRLRRDAVRSS